MSPPPDPQAGINLVVLLFVATALVLLTTFLVVLIGAVVRRRRRIAARSKGEERPETPDPWTESARRVQPFERDRGT
ncbi:MAG: hypothetical protein ACYTJ0_17905 [Planctomycetota bacterium]